MPVTPDQATEILRLREAKVAPKQIARKLQLRPAEVTAFIQDHAEEADLEKARSGDIQSLQECRVNRGAAESLLGLNGRQSDEEPKGICQIIVARQELNRLLVGSYLVDYWCMGLKNTLSPRIMGRREYSLFLESCQERFEEPFVTITLEQAQSIVYGAIDYARNLGIEPRDFSTKAQTHLGLRPETLIPMEFGQDGQPFFMSGPYDNAEQVIKTLEANVGAGNFHYMAAIGGFGSNSLMFDDPG
jgi:hypothetical protein